MGTEIFCQLHHGAAGGTRCPNNQNGFARFDIALIAREIQRSVAAKWHCRGLFKVKIGRLSGNRTILGHCNIFGMGPHFTARIRNHLVTQIEHGDVSANCLDHARQLCAKNLVSRARQPKHQPSDQPHSGRHFQAAGAPVAGADGGGVDFDQNFVGFGCWGRDFFDVHNIRGSVFGVNGGFHGGFPLAIVTGIISGFFGMR